jgi:hypothetical protein
LWWLGGTEMFANKIALVVFRDRSGRYSETLAFLF